MGIPQNYSRDIAVRCARLIHELLPRVESGLPGDEEFQGPLRTTFLLAMATPMLLLPIERIFKPASGALRAADDRELNPELSDKIVGTLGNGKKFGEASFAAGVRWSYVQNYGPFNTASEWPADLLSKLGSDGAAELAKETAAARIICDLRNALAHGSIAYLDEHGLNTDSQAAMFAFAGIRTIERGAIIGLNVLRIHENDFRKFLSAWAEWLQETGLESPSMRALLDSHRKYRHGRSVKP